MIVGSLRALARIIRPSMWAHNASAASHGIDAGRRARREAMDFAMASAKIRCMSANTASIAWRTSGSRVRELGSEVAESTTWHACWWPAACTRGGR